MPRTPKPCGHMWQQDGGVDLACLIDGKTHTIRLRFCLDGERRVRLMGTGVVGRQLVRAEIGPRGISVTPRRCKPFLETCVRNSAGALVEEARRYLSRFSPPCRAMLDVSLLKGALQFVTRSGSKASRPRG